MPRPPTADVQTRWKPLVVCPGAALAARIRSALAELGIEDAVFLPQYPAPGAIAAYAAQQGCNLCFLDIATRPEQALLLIPEAARAVQVVALNPRKDADMILYCLRLGACEFLSEPTGEEIMALLDRLGRAAEPAESAAPSSVICVIPGKPGSGASTLATCLAVEMKRRGTSKVLLVDTDPITSSVAFLLKLKPSFHLGDAVRDWDRMDGDLWSHLVIPCQGLDVLPAPEDPATCLPLDPQSAQGLLSFWRQHYETILLDIGGVHSAGAEFAPLADEVLLATTNELAALHATRRSGECLQKNSVDPARVKLVISRYMPSAGLKRESLETALKVEPYALLPDDWDAVQTALLDGKPVAPGSHLGRGIRVLAERLLGKEQTVRKRSTFFGLLPARG